MLFDFLLSLNYLAIFVSAVAFFMLGSFWFSGLFGALWLKELKKHNVSLKQPTSKELTLKMLLTFFSNIVASFAVACIIFLTGAYTFPAALLVGVILALGLAASSISSIFI